MMQRLALFLCTVLLLLTSFAHSPAANAEPLDSIDPGSAADVNQEREARREFEREERARRDIERERGSVRSHVERVAGDAAKGQIKALAEGDIFDALSGQGMLKEVLKECVTGCHAPDVVKKFNEKLDRLGTSGQRFRDEQKFRDRLRQFEATTSPLILLVTEDPPPVTQQPSPRRQREPRGRGGNLNL